MKNGMVKYSNMLAANKATSLSVDPLHSVYAQHIDKLGNIVETIVYKSQFVNFNSVFMCYFEDGKVYQVSPANRDITKVFPVEGSHIYLIVKSEYEENVTMVNMQQTDEAYSIYDSYQRNDNKGVKYFKSQRIEFGKPKSRMSVYRKKDN